ncbi:hypothetical protein FGO68_gene8389 [Halteria grandinella]|uniref:Uncharacterized protein n=1 Tax=Halteria grandinella TaxID=5974 RepID=A0A8J8NYN2_HALGN|nr:hypothetical protein FGO68_gene8389 [Halteria grandinella]
MISNAQNYEELKLQQCHNLLKPLYFQFQILALQQFKSNSMQCQIHCLKLSFCQNDSQSIPFDKIPMSFQFLKFQGQSYALLNMKLESESTIEEIFINLIYNPKEVKKLNARINLPQSEEQVFWNNFSINGSYQVTCQMDLALGDHDHLIIMYRPYQPLTNTLIGVSQSYD